MAISFPSDFIANHLASTTVTKTYGAAVAAGDVLVAFVVAQNLADTTITVSDSVNGAWTQAGTITDPVNARIIGFYKVNSAAGTPVVTLTGNTTNRKTIAISSIKGLTSGGAFDQWKALQGQSTTPNTGDSATLASANSAVVAALQGGASPSGTDAGWTVDLIFDPFGKERFVRKITTTTTPVKAGWTSANQNYCAAEMVFTDVGDTTAPTLTSPTGTQTGSTTASGTVSTDEANGTLYYLASTNATETAATVKAASSQTVTATGSQAVSLTGLTASTTYYLHYCHRDAAGNDSTVANSTSFTTAAAGSTYAPNINKPRSGMGTNFYGAR